MVPQPRCLVDAAAAAVVVVATAAAGVVGTDVAGVVATAAVAVDAAAVPQLGQVEVASDALRGSATALPDQCPPDPRMSRKPCEMLDQPSVAVEGVDVELPAARLLFPAGPHRAFAVAAPAEHRMIVRIDAVRAVLGGPAGYHCCCQVACAADEVATAARRNSEQAAVKEVVEVCSAV